jgi:phosphoribosylformylglycinamidine cyclo-ligase
MAHVTGGGLAANVARVLPSTTSALVDRGTWRPSPVFGLVGELGRVSREELESTLNMGVGMVAVVPPERADEAAGLLARGVESWVCGEVSGASGGAATLHGAYA